MKILLICHSFNSLTQRLHVELRERGHRVSVELDVNDANTREAVDLFEPDLVIAPFLKRAISPDVLACALCLVVHPGPRGDRGPSALDWAILEGRRRWGVTLIEATSELDGGPIWAWREFDVRAATKSSLYRREATRAAIACVEQAIAMIGRGERPESDPAAPKPLRGSCRREDRRVDFATDSVAAVLRKIRSADGAPGAPAILFGRDTLVFDAHEAHGLAGSPGAALARSGPAVAVAARDGVVWIGHARDPAPGAVKLPASAVFAAEVAALPERDGYPRIRSELEGAVAYLHFPFYNGAMATDDCRALTEAIAGVRRAGLRVLVLMGGPDYWSNGLHLGRIETASSPADKSWANINAMNDCVKELIEADDLIVVAAMRGNAGAGGVFLALAADEVWMRDGVVLNPHYKDMGNLYGSEYWTYLLPRRVGENRARSLAAARLPMGAAEAARLGLVDRVLAEEECEANRQLRQAAAEIAAAGDYPSRLKEKKARRARDEAERPLAAYREAELENMRRNFWGFDPSYHIARHNFIRKIPKSRTPVTLALHRSLPKRMKSPETV